MTVEALDEAGRAVVREAARCGATVVGVKVLSENPLTGDRAHCCSAYVTMVSLDAGGRPAEVPGLQTGTTEDRRRQRDAQRRRRSRLASPQRRSRPAPRRRRGTPATG